MLETLTMERPSLTEWGDGQASAGSGGVDHQSVAEASSVVGGVASNHFYPNQQYPHSYGGGSAGDGEVHYGYGGSAPPPYTSTALSKSFLNDASSDPVGGADLALNQSLEADKLAFGRSSDYQLHADGSYGPVGGVGQTYLPHSESWMGTGTANATGGGLWEDRDASVSLPPSTISRSVSSPPEGDRNIWSQHRGNDDHSRTSASSHSTSPHNNTTLPVRNPRRLSASGSLTTAGSDSTIWLQGGAPPGYSSQLHHGEDSFANSLSQMSFGQGEQQDQSEPLSLNRRVSTETFATPEQSPKAPRGLPQVTHEEDRSPSSYFLPSASFSDQHMPSLPLYQSSSASVPEPVPSGSASTFTNDSSMLNTSITSSPPTVSSATVVPPTPGYNRPQQHQRNHQQNKQHHARGGARHSASFSSSASQPDGRGYGRSYNRSASNRSYDSHGGGGGGGNRRRGGRNSRHHGGGGGRKQPRSQFPPPGHKERNSPPGKRNKESDGFSIASTASPSTSSMQIQTNDSSSPEGRASLDSNGSSLPTSSQAILQLIKPKQQQQDESGGFKTEGGASSWPRNPYLSSPTTSIASDSKPILPLERPEDHADFSFQYHDYEYEAGGDNEDAVLMVDTNGGQLTSTGDRHMSFDEDDDSASWTSRENPYGSESTQSQVPAGSKKQEWLLRMNKKLQDTPVGELDVADIPVAAVMNAWAKSKSAQGASMVELWLLRAQQEANKGNDRVVPTNKMYTMAVDAWARSGEGGAAAQRAESLLQQMHELYRKSHDDNLRPTTGIFNAVINAWARSKEHTAPVRAEQILNWMQQLSPDLQVQPDKYTFNTVIHAYAKAGGPDAAVKAQQLLTKMHQLYQEGNLLAKPDTITYNVVINCWAKSGGKGAAKEAEKLLKKMHRLHNMGDTEVKPNVVTYGAVIDAFAKCGESGAAERADTLLANMIELHQSDPVGHADLMPNTYVFNTVINCWAKSKESDAAVKAEEMLLAMGRLHASGMPSLKPDAFTYTAVIDAWAKSGDRGAARRADQLLGKMETKHLAGDADLKPNTFTYNAVINALAKSGEPGAAARAERVLQRMVDRHRNGEGEDVKPTTINFNTVLDAWAKSGGGRAAAERAEQIMTWMNTLHQQGNHDVKPDTITFNAVLDAWARSGDNVAPRRAEQILDHMDELYRAGNQGVKPDTYTYNTLINAWAKTGERGSAARAERVLSIMQKRYRDGDTDFKPNTRTHTSVIDAWAKSGEKGAAIHANQILQDMKSRFEVTGDVDAKPNVHTANAVCNACAFSKHEDDRIKALQIAFGVFDWLLSQDDMMPDSYTYTILLSVCANLIPRHELFRGLTRFDHARAFFERCRDTGYVNDYVLDKLRRTVTDEEFQSLIEYRAESSARSMPPFWSRNTRLDTFSKHQHNHHRKGKHGRRRG